MKGNIIIKLVLDDNIDFMTKVKTVKYIDRSFKGDTSVIKKMSSSVKNMTEDKGFNK